ncbi:pentapeptide repeat-containing protein [Roseofilum sp. BLCC_M91]|uniref:Pentapeptide repeat-containing protein n=1 Tax=Roseofilum halophilum BLCC-M91 TaxID=3022259 RepID=A0ABT7BGZ5_9CYAN|nr:pentapeptide repeat-containing protein [Roseofilum halophilum]MDJ1177548.1 pentapeptide repeat-containing protein [Roseofilum halophilum BLCC-M91]
MADEMAQYHSQVDGEIKGLSIGTGNVIYNYFYSHPSPTTNEDVTETDTLPCPYRGLFHFGPKDAEYFFGRDDSIKKLYQATQTRNFIPVLGASGSGKSSVVFAGLVPKLEAEGSWQFTYFRPGVIRKDNKQEIPDPFYALATALVPLYVPDADETEQLKQGRRLAESLRSREILLSDVITRIQRHYPGDRLLLIADQFEELYTLCTDPKVRHQFLDILIDNIYTPSADSPLVLVLTMRADFLGNALSYASFAQVLNDDMKLGAMNHTELRDVIEKPAQKLGVTFELGLVETILDDVEDEPGNLPLLEFALTELWKGRKGKKITHLAYQDIGKVQGALTRHADRILSKLTPEETKAAQRIFLKLVNLGEGTGDTRRQVTQAEIGVSNWHFVKQLADNRLVVTSDTNNQETVEVIHEALIRNWSQLREWIDESREAMRTARKIEAEAKEWETQGRNKGYLLQDRRLRDAKEFMQFDHTEVELSELVKDFIKASQWKQRRSGFMEIMLVFVALVFLLGSLRVAFDWSAIMLVKHILIQDTCTNHWLTDWVKSPLLRYFLWSQEHQNISNMKLCKLNLSGVIDLSNNPGLYLENVDFSNTNLKDSKFPEIHFSDSNFTNAEFEDANLQNTHFMSSPLDKANFKNADLKNAVFSNVTPKQISFNTNKLEGIIFINSDLSDLANDENITKKISSGSIKICCSKLSGNLMKYSHRDCKDPKVSQLIDYPAYCKTPR